MFYETEDGLQLNCRDIAEEFFKGMPDIMAVDDIPVYLSKKIAELQDVCGQLPESFIGRVHEIFDALFNGQQELTSQLSPEERAQQIMKDAFLNTQLRSDPPGALLCIAQ
jgi:hypothetical protein